MTSNVLFWRYIPIAKHSISVLKSEVGYKNPVNAKDLTPTPPFWQIMVINMLRHGGHLDDVRSFGVYLL